MMKSLYRTAALALIMSATGLAGAHAQTGDEEKTSTDMQEMQSEEMNSEEMQSDTAQSGDMPSDETQSGEASTDDETDGQSDGAETASAAGSDYCERQWMTLDGNEDGFISSEEASGGLEARFDAIDADGNDAITKTEYIDCKTGTGATAADAGRDDATFEAADADSDGALTRQEYGDAAATAYEEAIATDDTLQPFIVLRRYVFLTPVEAENENPLADMSQGEIAARSLRNFSFLDADGNGEISMSEWRIQTPTVGMTNDAASAQFTELDANGDDEISRAEFQAQVAGTPSGGQAAGEGEQASAEGVPVFIWWYE